MIGPWYVFGIYLLISLFSLGYNLHELRNGRPVSKFFHTTALITMFIAGVYLIHALKGE